MDLIDTITHTRETASAILSSSLSNLIGKTEAEVRDLILAEQSKHTELSSHGWYDPPEGGVSVLFADTPFARLQFDTLRNPEYFASASSTFGPESIGTVYLSPVDKKTGLFGDIGLSIYRGEDRMIREHLRTSLLTLLEAANQAEVGMKFSDLYESAMRMFKERSNKTVGWMTTNHDPLKINLGHTMPGSYGDAPIPIDAFDSTREAIRTRRIYINEIETFKIPPTCAFTVEARLTDLEAKMPNVFFHVIVTFDNGKKEVLTNFNGIFRSMGMDYML